VRSSWCPKASVHIHDAQTGEALALKILPTTTPSANTSKSSSFHSPDGRLAEARLRMRGGLIRRRGSRPAESRPAAAADCQDWKHCKTDTAYRPRRIRKPCRRSRDGHHASRKPNRCPDSGCISFGDSCQDKLAIGHVAADPQSLNLTLIAARRTGVRRYG
jgi:hypothetical protein